DPGPEGPQGPMGDVTPEALAAKSDAELAASAAADARDDAQSAASDAEEHKQAVEAVVATNDGIMTAVAQDEGSDFHSVLTGLVDAAAAPLSVVSSRTAPIVGAHRAANGQPENTIEAMETLSAWTKAIEIDVR